MTSTPGQPVDQPDDDAAAESWACGAYGKELAEKMQVQRVCFFPHRPCISAAECSDRMTDERQRTFDRIQELATVDPLFADLAEEFPSPDTLLGGPGSRSGSGT